MSGGRWIPAPLGWWREIAAALEGVEWPTEAACLDLRAMEAEGSIPGRPALRRRWGWTDHRVRSLLKNESLWREVRQPTASQPPENQPKMQDEPYSVASTSPANRHTRANYNYNSIFRSLPPVDGLQDALEAYLKHRGAIGLETTQRDLQAILERILDAHGRGLDSVTALRLAVAKGWKYFFPKAPPVPTPSTQRPTTAQSGSEEWDAVLDALVYWGRRPPGHGRDPWGFTSDPSTEARILAGIQAAGEADDILSAWTALHDQNRDKRFMKWAKIRFVRTFKTHTPTHDTHTRETA